jgi:hypothetical protein
MYHGEHSFSLDAGTVVGEQKRETAMNGAGML